MSRNSHFNDLKNWYKRNLRWIYLFAGLIIVPPVIFNGIILLDIPRFSVAQNNDWIGFFGGFLGSIIGGALTLIGVRLTLTSQEERNFLDEVPKKFRRIDMVLAMIEDLLNQMKIEKSGDQTIIFFNKIKVYKDLELIMQEASNTDAETYNAVHSIKISLDLFFELNWEYVSLDDWGNNILKEKEKNKFIDGLLTLNKSVEAMDKLIRRHRKDLSNRYFDLVRDKY